ncbi:hypothetical protein NB614_20745 [Vibrio parahaemolyticus]|uniref:DUF7660 family protein n=1 Tax=Vibrio parahaemolyticus TaxID=670 RepID=UPI0006B29D89|nr:hypothetical protein [Vibrio parahaemolyticus]KOY37918.1 hypothetical protein ACX08_04705 [Vibrio parahaemolyticus]MCR9877041.1 hypothetical protein [Vibrio parahaemolyticus]
MNQSSVKSKAELLSLIESLSSENDKCWENSSAIDFIQALGAWLNDAEGYYKNVDLDVNEASWQLFADALQAARNYE